MLYLGKRSSSYFTVLSIKCHKCKLLALFKGSYSWTFQSYLSLFVSYVLCVCFLLDIACFPSPLTQQITDCLFILVACLFTYLLFIMQIVHSPCALFLLFQKKRQVQHQKIPHLVYCLLVIERQDTLYLNLTSFLVF